MKANTLSVMEHDKEVFLGLVAPKRKRGGRKKGSKNKPKVNACNTQHVDVQFTAPQIQSANFAQCIRYLELYLGQIAAARPSAMDSESKLTEIIRHQAALAEQALAVLRGMA